MEGTGKNPGGRDPLLTTARILLTVAMVLTAIGAAIALMAVPVLHVMRGEPGMDIITDHMPRVAVLLVLASVMAVLAFFFIRHLRRIVDSVAHGDPFAPANADRLRYMAWLTVAYQVVQIPVAGLAIWWDAAPMKANVHYGDDGISFATIILALILFILARVFRQGAAMREDLEGTV